MDPSAASASPAALHELPRASKRRANRELLERAVLRVVLATLRRMPYDRAVALGAALGTLYGASTSALGTREHRIATQNLARALPELSRGLRDEIHAGMWRNWGRALAEIALLPTLDQAALRDLVRLDPPDGPREIFARARETGSLVLTAHFGSFELLHAACAAYGYPITVVHRTLRSRYVDEWLTALRERAGTGVLRTGAAARSILRALRAERVVAIPFDQRPHEGPQVRVPFFGIPTWTSSGLARLALASHAPVFPVALVRERESIRHRALFAPPIALVRSDDREADVRENTRRLNAALESLVREDPAQWIWMYNRWKPPRKERHGEGATASGDGGRGGQRKPYSLSFLYSPARVNPRTRAARSTLPPS